MSYAFSDGTLIDRSYDGLVFGRDGRILGQTWLEPGALKLREIAQTQLHYSLQELASRENNWDGRGSLAANGRSVFEASAFLEAALKNTIDLQLNWSSPHLGLDEYGYVVMEWWSGRNKLTIYITPNFPEYVCSWGQNIDEHMHSDEFKAGDFPRLWRWLWTQTN